MSFKKMAITPLDFPAIIGLSFFGEHVFASNEAYMSTVLRNIWLKDFCRFIVAVKSSYVSLV